MDERKKFRLADVILSVICVVFVAEAAAPVASIGNSQYFWWLFMMVAFLLPYGMISSELGTTYPGDGGLYDWIHKAFPETKWGARASWYYWINFPLWMASLAVVCPELLGVLTGLRFGWGARLLIELAFIWVVTWIACYPVWHPHPQHQRRHQDAPRADGGRARHRLCCAQRLCQRHGAAHVPAGL